MNERFSTQENTNPNNRDWHKIDAPLQPPTDAERFSADIERISVRLIDLNTLLADKLISYSSPSVGKAEVPKENKQRNYNSSYFNHLGNMTEPMLKAINNMDKLIEDLEI